jgi:Domain of unknown function (DUF4386)
LVTSHALATLYDRIFLQGQSFMPAICDLLLGFLLYQSRLVPRGLALIGIVGGPILLAGYLAVMFGLLGLHAPLAGLSAIPVALFEFSLGVWLVVKGLRLRGCMTPHLVDTRTVFLVLEPPGMLSVQKASFDMLTPQRTLKRIGTRI